MRLIDAERLYNTIIDEIDPISISMDGGEMRGMMRTIIAAEPTIEAVPLDKLCEWLAGNRIEIPCKCCKYYLGDDKCSAIIDMTKPCPNTADEWRYVLTKWMEEQDAAD